MYAASSALIAAVGGSHTAAAKVEVWQAGVNVLTLDSTTTNGRAGVVSGSVVQDRTAAIRTTATLTLTDPDGVITPVSNSSALQPYGQEIRPYRGVLVNGAIEWVPLGVLPIITAVRSDDGDYTISIEASDRAWTVGRRKSTTGGYGIAAGTNAATAVQAIIASRLTGPAYASMSFNLAPTSVTLPALYYDETQDLWAAATDIATALGMDLYFDRLGNPTMQPVRDASTDPITSTLSEGANLVHAKVTVTASDTYSRAIVSGESNGSGSAPVRASVADTDPASPTYYLGPFGDVPTFLTSPLIITQGQALVVATALLKRVKGLTETANVTALPDPTIDAGDAIKVVRKRAAINGNYVVESVTHSLTPADTVTITGRKRP